MADSFDDEDNEISWLNGQSSSPKKLSPIKSLSPALARRPPEIDLSTQKLPIQNQQKRSKKLIPENVPFSELNDEIFGNSPKKQNTTTVEKEFFGVYCLISKSENRSYKNRCYIGYTVDPNRRIKQHNSGKDHGGAKKTDSRGPWDMVCIIHGFPNSVSALRFEWAWQNPDKSRRLRDIKLKKDKKESPFQFRLRILSNLLNSDPWKRLSLNFRWLMPEYETQFPEKFNNLTHIERKFGLVQKEGEMVPKDPQDYESIKPCSICKNNISTISELVRCQTKNICGSHFHIYCLAKKALTESKEFDTCLIPIKGRCPRCFGTWRWGDLIQDQRTLIQISQIAGENLKIFNAEKLIPKNSTVG